MEKSAQGRKKRSLILAGICCLFAFTVFFGTCKSSSTVTVSAATKKTAQTTKKKTTKSTTKKTVKKKAAKAAKKAVKPPELNTNSKTIMKLNTGLLTTYEEYVAYPMNCYTLKVNNKPAKATYKWRSSDSEVASLTYNKKKGTCRVNAKAGGNTTITCTINAGGGKKYVRTCLIRVKNPATSVKIVSEDTEIENMECSLALDREYQFLANVKSKYTSDRIYWSISDEEIAEVDENGFVTPKQEGRTVLTAVAAPAGYDPAIDKYDVIIYAVVINVTEPMEKVTNVSVMTTGTVVVEFSAEIEEGSLFEFSSDTEEKTGEAAKRMTGVSLKATSGASGTGSVIGYLSSDFRQLYLVPEDSPNGKYKLKISDLVAQNGHRVEDYEGSVTIKNDSVSVEGANFKSISRTSLTVVTAVFDKTIIRPGTMTVSTSGALTLTEVQGKIGADPSTVVYTLTPEMQEISGIASVSLSGYAASGDSAEEGEENIWIVDVDFTFSTEVETLDTSDQPLPPPSNITQALDSNSKVYVIFQNRVDEESARTVTNYKFSDGPVITEAEVISNTDQGCMVGLSIEANSIPEIKEYELEVSNVKGFDNAYLPMENYKQKIKMNDNKPAFYKSSQFIKGTPIKVILTFSENIDFGSASRFFDIEANWIGQDENGNTVPKRTTIYNYEATASGSDNRMTIELSPEEELPLGTTIRISPINYGTTGTYLVDEGGNVVELASVEVQVS